jgi:hypothetical protein
MNVSTVISSAKSYLKQIHNMSVKSGILACCCLSSICSVVEIQSVCNNFPENGNMSPTKVSKLRIESSMFAEICPCWFVCFCVEKISDDQKHPLSTVCSFAVVLQRTYVP